jgi:hypothetical protein
LFLTLVALGKIIKGIVMPLTAYVPKDLVRYRRHEKSVLFSSSLLAGVYVYVQDCSGEMCVAPDGPHMHPRVLGGARAVVAAGELTLGEAGEVIAINNLSGTFQCTRDSLLLAVGAIICQGGKIDAGAISRYEV